MSSGCRMVNQKGSSKLVLLTRRALEDKTNNQVFWGGACAVHTVMGERGQCAGVQRREPPHGHLQIRGQSNPVCVSIVVRCHVDHVCYF